MPNSDDILVTLADGKIVVVTAIQDAFIEAYRLCGNISKAARCAGVSRSRHHCWLQDEGYKTLFEEADAEAKDMLLETARDRAINGLKKLRTDRHGFPIRDPRKYFINSDGTIGDIKPEWEQDPWLYDETRSDRLLELLLKSGFGFADAFKDRVQQEVSGAGVVIQLPENGRDKPDDLH